MNHDEARGYTEEEWQEIVADNCRRFSGEKATQGVTVPKAQVEGNNSDGENE